MCVGDLYFKLLEFWGETAEQHNETASLVFSLLNNASAGKVWNGKNVLASSQRIPH